MCMRGVLHACVCACGQGGGNEGALLCSPGPSPVPHCDGVDGLASAGALRATIGVSPRVVYRTVYRQVVKTDHRKRLQCCQGFYESRGTCVRESWVGAGWW